MKIVLVDNFNRDHVSDRLIAENVSEYYAEIIVNALNTRVLADAPDFFRAMPDDYKLYKFRP